MIRPIAPTHREAADKAERIKHAETTLKAAERHDLIDNVAYGAIFIIVVTGALLLGKLISVIVRCL